MSYEKEHKGNGTLKDNVEIAANGEDIETKETGDSNTEVGDMMDTRFGIGLFKPHAFQCFATVGWFTAFYSLASLLMSTIIVYVNSQITTLERQFGFSSKQTGLIMAANDIGYLLFVIFVSYLAKTVHIPRALGSATIIFGLSGLICSFPYFIYGSTLNKDVTNDNITSLAMKGELNLRNNESIFGQLCTFENRSAVICDTGKEDNPDKSSSSTKDAVVASLAIIVAGMMLQGFGKAPRASFSIVYIDDNTNRVKSGFYFGIFIAISIMGPAVAFLMGGVFSRIYVTLGETDLYPKHPKWIGAWWLGFLVFGGMALVVSLPLFCFPFKLPRKNKDSNYSAKGEKSAGDVENASQALIKKDDDVKNDHKHHHTNNHQSHDNNSKETDKHNLITGTKDGEKKSAGQIVAHQSKLFFSSFFRIITNPIFVLMVSSNCFILFMVGGSSAYSPKYLERVFDLPAYKANYIMAGKTLVASCVGTFIGGCLTKYYKMTAKKALRFVVAVVGISMGLSVASLFTYCEQPETYNWPGSGESCQDDCHCEDKYFPVCGSDGKTYYSPCLAGCDHHVDGTYTNCTCIDGGLATTGICPYGCDHVYYFTMVNGLRSLFGTLAIIPKMTVIIRSVEERDKSLALGFSSFMSSMLGWLLGPVAFGILIDGICVLWDQKCGVMGRCFLYDNNLFRWKLNGFSCLGVGGSLVFQLTAFFYSWKTGCLDDIDVDGRKDEVELKKVKKKIGSDGKKSDNHEKEGGEMGEKLSIKLQSLIEAEELGEKEPQEEGEGEHEKESEGLGVEEDGSHCRGENGDFEVKQNDASLDGGNDGADTDMAKHEGVETIVVAEVEEEEEEEKNGGVEIEGNEVVKNGVEKEAESTNQNVEGEKVEVDVTMSNKSDDESVKANEEMNAENIRT